MIKSFKKIRDGTKFTLLMIIIYILLGLINPVIASVALGNFFEAIVKIFPLLILVFFIVFIINLLLKPETISKHLGENAGFRGWFYAVFGSIIISSPPYITFPLLGELKKHGMKYKFIAVFLNTRNVQLAFLPVMAHYFGWLFAGVISAYIIIYSILSGIILEKFMKRKNIFQQNEPIKH